MCAIIYLKSGQMPPLEMLSNAVYNNWHSYGLVVRKNKKLQVTKKVPETEVDPAEVFKLLQDNIESERFLHLRHNTAGATSEENAHPMTVYKGKNRQVEFMHNGTMHLYKSRKTVNGVTSDDDDGPSDTRNFADRVLIPYLSAFDAGNGKGDISSGLFQELVKRFWPTSDNRGVLISSDQPPLFIDTWHEVGPEGSKFKASNNLYFDKVTRGPEYTRRSLREEAQKKSKSPTGTTNIAALKDYKIGEKHDFFSLSSNLCNITSDWDVYDRPGAVALGYATREELDELYKDEKNCKIIMDWVFTDYAHLYEEFQELAVKYGKAQAACENLGNENSKLRLLKGKAA